MRPVVCALGALSPREIRSAMVPGSDLRQALLGTWRLIKFQADADGTVVKPHGGDPQGCLVYTPDGHVLIMVAARQRPELFRMTAQGMPRCSIRPKPTLNWAMPTTAERLRYGMARSNTTSNSACCQGLLVLLRDTRPYSMVTG